MMKKVMILGAGVYQVPLINKAKELGHYVIVVSPIGNYPGIQLADKFIDCDTTNVIKVLEEAKSFKIDAILTTGTDVCVPTIGKVVDELKLHGTGYEASIRSMDKVKMKEAFHENNVPTAKFKVLTNYSEARDFIDSVKLPVMVKANDSSGSRGITRVDDVLLFKMAWDRAFEVSKSKQIIIEEFLEGVEFGAQAIIHGDELVEIFIHSDTVSEAPYFTPIGHSIPAYNLGQINDDVKNVLKKTIKAIGLKDCIANVDFMLVNGKPFIIEIGARMGATCLPENIIYYSGFDIYKHLINLSLGIFDDVKFDFVQPNACLLLRSKSGGILKDIHMPTEVLDHKELIELKIDVKVGDRVNEFRTGPDRLGHIIVKADSALLAESIASDLVEKIKFILD
jgi:biotin carboxylase